jgi:thiamine biosynthesis lipoprotein
VAVALDAAYRTGGDVSPTVGGALVHLGYDRDLALLPATNRQAAPRVSAVPNWRDVRLDGRDLTVPPGVLLDLGATAKAHAADRCARLAAVGCGTGVLVSLGGDIATAGPAPDGGWRVLVQDGPAQPGETVALPAGAALATSSTISRQWRAGGRLLHHILDPRTCQPAPPVWRTVSVAAARCLDANTAGTAAIVRGHRALDWLRAQGLPARLVDADGRVRTLGGWP